MTRDVFGNCIHTCKFHEGVTDGVILDLKYEARDVPQRLTSQAAIDNWFEHKTRTSSRGLTTTAARRSWWRRRAGGCNHGARHIRLNYPA